MKIRKIKPTSRKELKAEAPIGPRYPYFNIDLKHLSEAKKWEIKGKYRVVLDIDMTGLNIEKEVKEDTGRASFDIVGIGILPRAKPKKEKVKRYS